MNHQFDVAGTDVLNDVSAALPSKGTARYEGVSYVGSILLNVAADTLYLQMTPAGRGGGGGCSFVRQRAERRVGFGGKIARGVRWIPAVENDEIRNQFF